MYKKFNIDPTQKNVDTIKKHSNEFCKHIQYGDYLYTYVISDIHADVRKFIMILLQTNIISVLDEQITN